MKATCRGSGLRRLWWAANYPTSSGRRRCGSCLQQLSLALLAPWLGPLSCIVIPFYLSPPLHLPLRLSLPSSSHVPLSLCLYVSYLVCDSCSFLLFLFRALFPCSSSLSSAFSSYYSFVLSYSSLRYPSLLLILYVACCFMCIASPSLVLRPFLFLLL